MDKEASQLMEQIKALQFEIYVRHSTSYHHQLVALSGVLGLSLLLALSSLFVRAWRRNLWLYRLQTLPCGTWIVPNAIGCWLVWSALGHGLLQAYVHSLLAFGNPGTDLIDDQIWRTICWLPIWLGGVNMTWATVLAPLLYLPSGDNDILSSILNHQHASKLTNSVFLSAQLGVSSLIIALSIRSNRYFNRVFSVVQELTKVLKELATASQTGQVETAQMLQRQISPLQSQLQDEVTNARFWTWVLWISWSVAAICWLVVGHHSPNLDGRQFELTRLTTRQIFTTAAFLYFHGLRKAIRNVKEDNRRTKTMSSRELQALIFGYRSLQFTAASVIAMATGYGVLATVEINQPTKESVLLASLYLFAVFGLLSNMHILYRSFASQPRRPRQSLASQSSPAPSSQRRSSSTSKSPSESIWLERLDSSLRKDENEAARPDSFVILGIAA
ncbi:hypothetical protein T439DRAFT_350040 [Meredithblackwellia eburnea MCA 4105]